MDSRATRAARQPSTAAEGELSQQPLAEDRPHGKRETTTIVARDVALPERPEHRLDARIEIAELERRLVLGRVVLQHVSRGPAGVGDHDVDAAADRALAPSERPRPR